MDGSTGSIIEQDRGNGRPLPEPVRARMESAFGRGFPDVRIHDGEGAAGAARAVSATAFTTGSDIYFAAGGFRPDSRAGERVLAHELAHVIQGDQDVHRLFGFGKKDPAAEAAAAAKKKDEADRKAARKDSQDKDKAETKRLKEERVKGKSGRAELGASVTADQTSGSKTSATSNELNALFEKALAAEKAKVTEFIGAGDADVAAAQKAYDAIWLPESGEFASLRSVRPPRETAAERLTSAVRAARTEASVRESMNTKGQRGTMLPPEVEAIYEDYVGKISELMQPPASKPAADAEAEGERIWDLPENAEAKKKRPPKGDPVDLKARQDAEKRAVVRLGPDKEPGLDGDIQSAKDAEGYHGMAQGVLGVVPMALGKAGAAGTKQKQQQAGVYSAPTGGLEQQVPGGIGAFTKSVQDVESRKAKGKKDDAPEKAKPQTVETQAAAGFAAAQGVLTDIFSVVTGLMEFVKNVQKAHTTTDARKVMEATKSASSVVGSLGSAAKNTAGLAKAIDPGVTTAVGSVIPGLNILTSVTSMINATLRMADSAMRVNETNEALAGARERKSDKAPDILVLPMMRVLESYTKGLEQTVWTTVMTITDFSTAVATVASGGGFGIPTAVAAGAKVLNLLHDAGHLIADQVLVSITKQSQTDALQALEGAAERQLKNDPAMAVDGIVMIAMKGDPIAVEFLSHYEVDGKAIDAAVLKTITGDPRKGGDQAAFTRIRGAVLAAMGEQADPQYVFQTWKKKIGSVVGKVKSATVGKGATISQLAKDRQQLDGRERGVAWRFKMLFNSEQSLAQSAAKTAAKKDAQPGTATPSASTGPIVGDNSTFGLSRNAHQAQLECVCGRARLLVGASEQQRKVFESQVAAMPDDALQRAAVDPHNSPVWQQLFADLLHDRVQASVSTGA